MSSPLSSVNSARLLVVQLFCSISFYSFGTAMMDYFAMYPSWEHISAGEFPAYHVFVGQRIIVISVLPFVVLTLLNLLLFFFRPASLPRSLVVASFVCFAVGWASSLLIQIPMQLQLEVRQDREILQHLMATNWIRVVVETAQALLAFRMLQQITGSCPPATVQRFTDRSD